MPWKIKLSGSLFISFVFILVTLFLTVLLFNETESYPDAFKAEKGKIELSSSDFRFNIALNGEWKYYDQKLPAIEKIPLLPHTFITVPHLKNTTGYGTYQLTISGLEKDRKYELLIPDLSSAYRLYIDADLKAKNGVIGTDSETEVLELKPLITCFTPKSNSIAITVQTSHFSSYPGGFIRPIKLGLPDNIEAENTKAISAQMILLGGMLMVALYNFSLFLLNTSDKAALYFSLFNLMMVIRLAITGERVVNLWITTAEWAFLYQLQFVIGAAMLGLFVLYMNYLFPKEFNWLISRCILSIALILGFLPFVTPAAQLSLIDYFFLITAVSYFFYLLWVLMKALRQKIQGSLFAFMGIAFVIGSIFLDNTLPPGTNIIPVGMFIFTIFHSLVIAEKHSAIVEQNKILYTTATRDGMTNLYKREHFRQLVQKNLDADRPLCQHAMLFLDIDNFKTINDKWGHNIGDKTIITASQHLMESLRYSDIACRYGGDEFIIWLHNAKHEEIKQITQRVLNQIAQPMQIDGHTIEVSMSIGISFYPEDGADFDTLSKICDRRMYKAKKSGKNQYCLSD